MAPLPPSNTIRYFLDYTVNGLEHTIQMRVGPGATDGGASGSFSAFLAALSPNLYALSVVGMRKANLGTDVTNPVTYTGTTSFGSGTAVDNLARAAFLSFIGRSTDGRRVRVFVYGTKITSEGDYRVDTGEAAEVADAIDVLNGASGVFLSISGLQAIWKAYANEGVNAYWQRRARV